MIEQTFQHIPGIGPWREKDLWARGVRTWKDFLASTSPVVISSKVDALARARIGRAQEALEQRDLVQLAQLIPAREHWRLYDVFSEQSAYFDIETEDARSPLPTVVSVFDSDGLHVFLRDRNLEELPGRLAQSKVWVTFNGSCFDIPVLKQFFGPTFPSPSLHLDLRFIVRKIGLSGGLKYIEEEMGIGRPPHLKGVSGMDAVTLWKNYIINGSAEALRLLIEYNLYDSIQLKSLMDLIYNGAVQALRCEVPARRVFDRSEVLYDVSRALLQWAPLQ